ncbi:hypothetical protein GCM10023238_12760 [Streptomyces heliomycini]
MLQRPVRNNAAGTSTIVVSIFYCLVQWAGERAPPSHLLHVIQPPSTTGKILHRPALVGVLMIVTSPSAA